MLNLEADGLHQLKTTPSDLMSAKNRKLILQFTQAHQDWTKKDLDFCCLLSAVQASGLIMCGIFSWHTFSLLIPTECRVNTTAYLGTDADHAHLFMTTVFKSSETGLLDMAIDSKVTRSQYNTATVWCCCVIMEQNLRGMIPAPCWVCAMMNEGSSEGIRGPAWY